MLKEAIRKEPIFDKLTSEEIDFITDGCVVYKFKKQELVCKQGLFSNYVFYVISGYVKLTVESWSDKELIIAIGTPQSFVGLFYLIGKDNYPYTVKALTEISVYMIPRDRFQNIAKQNAAFLYDLTCSMGGKMLQMSITLLSLNQKNVRGRVADILIYFSEQIFKADEFILPVTRLDIANIANMSVENAVRVLSEFDSDRIIKIDNKKISILNKKQLLTISLKG